MGATDSLCGSRWSGLFSRWKGAKGYVNSGRHTQTKRGESQRSVVWGACFSTVEHQPAAKLPPTVFLRTVLRVHLPLATTATATTWVRAAIVTGQAAAVAGLEHPGFKGFMPLQ